MSQGAVVALACGLTAVIAAYVALWLDHPPREPLLPLAIVVVAGGGLGPAALAFVERLRVMPVRDGVTLAVLAPLGLALIGLAAVRLLAGPLEGALLGTAGGAAAGAATVLSFARSGHPAAADALAAVCACVGAAAVLGALVGRARLAGRPAVAGALLLLGIALAAATAAPWLAGLAGRPVGAEGAVAAARVAVPLVGLVVGLLLAGRFERRVFERELGEEVANGILPDEVVFAVASYPRRIRSAWWPRGDERRALVGLLRRLAFRKQQLRHLEGDRLHLAGLEVGRARDRVRRLFDPREVEELAREFVG